MLKVENLQVFNLEGALKGMRFPMQSWAKSDSGEEYIGMLMPDNRLMATKEKQFFIGPNDLALAQKLIRTGSDHSKFLRQILVSMDITAPLYWWKEFDTYKVATVANSESTMHRLIKTPITMDCFSFDEEAGDLPVQSNFRFGGDINDIIKQDYKMIIDMCESYRQLYVLTEDKRYWRALIQLLPCAWNQKRHWTGNYSGLRGLCVSREGHKLSEWATFIDTIKEKAPYFKDFLEV